MDSVFTVMGYKVYAEFAKYTDGDAKAIRLVIAENSEDAFMGEPFCMVTVNIPGVELKENEVLAKTWSENEQIYKELVAKGFLKPTGVVAQTGHTFAAVCVANFPGQE